MQKKHTIIITCVQRTVSVCVFFSPVHSQIVFICDVAYRAGRKITDLSEC